MSKYAAILEKAAPGTDTLPQPAQLRPVARRVSGRRAYSELASKLFPATGALRVVAFVSVSKGEGVTRTVRGLRSELARCGKIVMVLDGSLQMGDTDGAGPAAEELDPGLAILGAPRKAEVETPDQLMTRLRERNECILLDCGSLDSSTDLLRLAPLADGIVLVVEAGHTAKAQIERADRVIREAEGTLLGFVLNKRRYPVPDWLYRRL